MDLLELGITTVILVATIGALAAIAAFVLRALHHRAFEATGHQLAELSRLHVEMATRIDSMRDTLAGRQAELHRAVNERLDSVTHHLSHSMTTAREHTVDSLQRLNERLAVIDGAQKNI